MILSTANHSYRCSTAFACLQSEYPRSSYWSLCTHPTTNHLAEHGTIWTCQYRLLNKLFRHASGHFVLEGKYLRVLMSSISTGIIACLRNILTNSTNASENSFCVFSTVKGRKYTTGAKYLGQKWNLDTPVSSPRWHFWHVSRYDIKRYFSWNPVFSGHLYC